MKAFQTLSSSPPPYGGTDTSAVCIQYSTFARKIKYILTSIALIRRNKSDYFLTVDKYPLCQWGRFYLTHFQTLFLLEPTTVHSHGPPHTSLCYGSRFASYWSNCSLCSLLRADLFGAVIPGSTIFTVIPGLTRNPEECATNTKMPDHVRHDVSI